MSDIYIYLFIKHENNSKNLTINNIYAVLHIELIEVIGYYGPQNLKYDWGKKVYMHIQRVRMYVHCKH